MTAPKKNRIRAPINIGDIVRIPFGEGYELKARVIEDRGNLGVGGRRILGIETLGQWEETRQRFEVVEEEVKILRRKRPAAKSESGARRQGYTSK